MCLVPNGGRRNGGQREQKRTKGRPGLLRPLHVCSGEPERSLQVCQPPQLILPAPPCWPVSPHPPLPDEKIQVPDRGVVVPGGGRGVDRRPCPPVQIGAPNLSGSQMKSLCRKTYSLTLAGSATLCTPPRLSHFLTACR